MQFRYCKLANVCSLARIVVDFKKSFDEHFCLRMILVLHSPKPPLPRRMCFRLNLPKQFNFTMEHQFDFFGFEYSLINRRIGLDHVYHSFCVRRVMVVHIQPTWR